MSKKPAAKSKPSATKQSGQEETKATQNKQETPETKATQNKQETQETKATQNKQETQATQATQATLAPMYTPEELEEQEHAARVRHNERTGGGEVRENELREQREAHNARTAGNKA